MMILIGASASGKTEVAKYLAYRHGVQKIITHTTRGKRTHEEDGVDYFFVSKDQFFKLKAKNYFVETTLYNDNFYGTSWKEIAENKCVVVNPNGLDSFLKINDRSIISFYLMADEKTRFNRMIIRGDNLENVRTRIKNDNEEFPEFLKDKVDFAIDTMNASIAEVGEQIFKLYKEKLAQIKQ